MFFDIADIERSSVPYESLPVPNCLHEVGYICTSSYPVMDDPKGIATVGIIDRTANPRSVSSAEILYLDEAGPSWG